MKKCYCHEKKALEIIYFALLILHTDFRKIIINPALLQNFLSLFILDEFLFISRKGEFARCHQGQIGLSQGWVGTKRSALHSQPHFFGNQEYTQTEGIQGAPVQTETS